MSDIEDLTKIPPCLGEFVYSSNGDDFNCEYDAQFDCEHCICNSNIGGKLDPRTDELFLGKITNN